MKKSIISKKMILMIVLIEIMGLSLFAYDKWSRENFDGTIDRPTSGENAIKSTYLAASERGEDEIEVEVLPISFSKKEVKRLLDSAKKEIDQSFKGANSSLEVVSEDVVIHDKYVEGMVDASWRFDNYKVIDSQGKIRFENIEEDTIVNALCDLKVGETESTYTFSFIVTKPSVNTGAGYKYYMSKALEGLNIDNPSSKSVKLPSRIEGIPVDWKPLSNLRGLEIMGLGIVLIGAVIIGQKEEEKRKKAQKIKLLERDYPDIVSNLSLYVGAGFSVKTAFQKIGENYKDRKIRSPTLYKPGFEEIIKLNHEIEDGRGELEAYRTFGKRIGQKDYRKLSLLLCQNLRKGTSGLVELLEKEEKDAFETRKTKAKILAQEASTKLLVPMFGLLAIILVILVYPALGGMNI